MKITKQVVLKKLEEVLDPELGISIVDLGLIYKVVIKKNKIFITMTLTTVGCPLFSIIESDIKNKIIELGFLEKNIVLKLTFDPLWDIDKITERGKIILGIS